jgi:Zn-dependent peptidase ImmA (M78 family)
MPALNPEILRWARETTGMSVEEAAQALLIKPARLRALEVGEEQPSRAVLLRMSKKYRRSLLTFYLATPPKRGDRGQDFRTLPPDRSIEDEAVLDALIRDLKARQSLVRSIVKDEEEVEPLNFVGSRTMADGVNSVVALIQKTLDVALEDYRAQDDYDAAFAYLRERAESAGVFVLLVGNLGSHHSAIPVEIFRGFAIADEYAPFVVINDQDARPAWTFTLLHELAHLCLGTTGISGGRADKDIEQFCNEVAGEFLLPADEVRGLNVTDKTSVDDAIAMITEFARPRRVSRAMVTFKLLRAKQINWETWRKFDDAIHQMWLRERDKYKAQQKKGDSGPSYYVVRRHRVGKALLNLVNRSMNAGALSPVRAAKVLGVKPRAVYPLLVYLRHETDARRGV